MEIREKIGLLELQEGIKEALEESFFDTLWLQAEISEMKVNQTGHCYLTLVEKDGGSGAILAKASAVIWAGTFRTLKPYFESATGSSLKAGMSVLVKVQVQYSALYGLSIIIYDIDPSFTVGELELERQRTIARLKEEGMFEMNSSLALPALPRRLAVITSETAAGYGDFMRHLHENEYGFRFETTLFQALMQGEESPRSIITALDRIAAEAERYDAVLILRGGGSAMDLVCFDDYELAVNVAQFPLPVLTAVGHEKDYHVIDMVAYAFVKTPTALADYFIDILSTEEYAVDSLAQRLQLALKGRFNYRMAEVEGWRVKVANAVNIRHLAEMRKLDLLEARVSAASPQDVLAKGYAIALKEGRRVSSAAMLAEGDELRLLLVDGTVDCKILKSEKI